MVFMEVYALGYTSSLSIIHMLSSSPVDVNTCKDLIFFLLSENLRDYRILIDIHWISQTFDEMMSG